MKQLLGRLLSAFIPANVPANAEAQRRALLTVAVLLIVIYFNLNYIVISSLINYPGGLYSQVPLLLVGIVTLLAYRRGVSPQLLYPVYFVSCSLSIATTVYFTAGYLSFLFPWLATTPIVALMVWSKRGGWLSAGIVLVLQLVFFALHLLSYQFPQQVEARYANVFKLTTDMGLVLILFAIAIVFENAKNGALDKLNAKNLELTHEQQKSENLLLNILPPQVAGELKETGSAQARYFENVTVLFLDFVGFTKISEQLSASALVSEINHCFTAFDHIVGRWDIEKIKTVGDAYIAAAGMPTPCADHASRAIRAALAMQAFMRDYQAQRRTQGQPFFECRIGIHSGDLVAGIVGTRKFAYDIWGDAVNTAARMEQTSAPGCINVSHTTQSLAAHEFQFEPRGHVEAKNKGSIQMYFVISQPSPAVLAAA